jgi:hypothetical protein
VVGRRIEGMLRAAGMRWPRERGGGTKVGRKLPTRNLTPVH